jgi:integrase
MVVAVLQKAARSPLQNLIDDYLMHCEARGLVPKTVGGYGYSLEEIFLPWCATEGITTVTELDRRALDRFTTTVLNRRHRDGRAISRDTVSHYIRPVRLLLNWAGREGEDVKAKPQLPRCEAKPKDVLCREEIERLERARPAERDKLILRIFGDCGLRLDELATLTPDAIVRTNGRQGFLRVLGKRGRVRDVPVLPHLLRRIERHIAERPEDRSCDRIFLTLRRGPDGHYRALSPHAIEDMVTDAGLRAKLGKPVYPHLLRHSWMTEMVRTGMHPFQLSVIAGASPPVIAKYYTHLAKADAYDAMARSLGAGSHGSRGKARHMLF